MFHNSKIMISTIINRLKGLISPKRLIKGILNIAQKPAESAIVAALASQGITLPPQTVTAVLAAVINVIEEHI